MYQNTFNVLTYPVINTEVPLVPERTYLFPLAPVGVGTAEVESLSSYIARLACEYHIFPKKLMTICIEKYTGEHTAFDKAFYNTFVSKSLNGISDTAESIVSFFEMATHRRDIIYTTLLPWKDILSPDQLRHKRAWCPVCLQADLEDKKIVYERLLWKIDIITICPIHLQALIDKCPHCKKTQFASSNCAPGFCYLCDSWLGEKKKSRPETESNSFSTSKEKWISIEIGKILSVSPVIKANIYERIKFANSLEFIKNCPSSITFREFEREIGMTKGLITRLIKCEKKLLLKYIIKICYQLKCSPVNLLLGRRFAITVPANSVNKRKTTKKIEFDPSQIPKPLLMKDIEIIMKEQITICSKSSTHKNLEKLTLCSYHALWILFPELHYQYHLNFRKYTKLHHNYKRKDAWLLTGRKLNKLFNEILEIISTLQKNKNTVSEESIRQELKRKVSDDTFWKLLKIAVNEFPEISND